ncbi:hypothetical protein FS837_000671 [Tulasnella sp. UAMH 9824]|nr:hypothetical protein FS837_000671 [Tulasnella sp. UAMH 9824]
MSFSTKASASDNAAMKAFFGNEIGWDLPHGLENHPNPDVKRWAPLDGETVAEYGYRTRAFPPLPEVLRRIPDNWWATQTTDRLLPARSSLLEELFAGPSGASAGVQPQPLSGAPGLVEGRGPSDGSGNGERPEQTHSQSSADSDAMVEDSDPKDAAVLSDNRASVTPTARTVLLPSALPSDDEGWTTVEKKKKSRKSRLEKLQKPPTVRPTPTVVGGVTYLVTPAPAGPSKRKAEPTPALDPIAEEGDQPSKPPKKVRKTKKVAAVPVVPDLPAPSAPTTFPFAVPDTKGKGRAVDPPTTPTNNVPLPPVGTATWVGIKATALEEEAEKRANAAKRKAEAAAAAKDSKQKETEADAEMDDHFADVFDQEYGAADIETDGYTVEFIKADIPRYVPSALSNRALPRSWKSYLIKHDLVVGKGSWLKFQVYGHLTPRDSDYALLRMALEHISEMNVGPSFKKDDVKVHPPVKGSPSIFVTTARPDIAEKIARLGQFSARGGKKSATFFVQHPAWKGSHVVFDVKNAPPKWSAIQSHVASIIEPVVRKKATSNAAKTVPTDFRYHEVETVSTGTTWRVAFEYDQAKMRSSQWRVPLSLVDLRNYGDVPVSEPPQCTRCISASHAVKECPWWSIGPVIGKKSRPSAARDVKWTKVVSYDRSEIEVEVEEDADEEGDSAMPAGSGAGPSK